MRTAIQVAAALGLAAILTGQVNKTAPPGYTTAVSAGLGSYSYTFGAYFDEISQIADGNYKGTAFSITELNLRRDEQAPQTYNCMGKTWTDFKLSVGDCDYANVTTTWSANFLSTPTVLTAGTLKWPDWVIQGKPAPAATPPEPWGDMFTAKGGCTTTGGKTTCTALKFPFSKPYVYSGKKDMLWEFHLWGGTLENAQPWGGYNKSYYLDGTSNRATVGGGVSTPTPYSAPIMTLCPRTGRTRVGYAYLRCVTYAVHNDPTLPKGSSDSWELSYIVRDTASVTGVIAISLFGTNDVNAPGSIYIGGKNAKGQAVVGCMPLGLDLTQPTLYHFCTTGTSTFTSYESTRYYVKYDKRFATTPNMATYGQFAYTDPTTKAFRLTGVGRSLIFEQPVLQPWKTKIIGDYGSGNRGPQPRAGKTPSNLNVPLLGYVTK
ncbi:MAG: hypothetical protein ACYS5W_24930 [Planctomycetota bacterium]|jgi:hypothetical protein